MTEATWATLRALFVDRYSEFKHRLARRLGSTDLAAETLQETWLTDDRRAMTASVQKAPDITVGVGDRMTGWRPMKMVMKSWVLVSGFRARDAALLRPDHASRFAD
jgi:hypothetical protein